MPTETIARKSEASTETQYTAKSFELVFSKFSSKYEEVLEPLTKRGAKDGSDRRFMSLPRNASVQQMGHRLNDVAQLMGEAPDWGDGQEDAVDLREAVLLSARYLAWNTVMGGITQQYVDRINDHIESEKRRGTFNANGHQSASRLGYDRSRGVSILLAQNHALRDYFDSGLAHTLGNDSPDQMSRLLNYSPFMSDESKDRIVRGISIEIACKRQLEQTLANSGAGDSQVAYGSDEQDSRGGDLVVLNGEEILFIDIKSSMPEKFSDGSLSTPQDHERGYKWIAHSEREHKVVVWAYQKGPVESGEFRLNDARLAHNLEQVLSSAHA